MVEGVGLSVQDLGFRARGLVFRVSGRLFTVVGIFPITLTPDPTPQTLNPQPDGAAALGEDALDFGLSLLLEKRLSKVSGGLFTVVCILPITPLLAPPEEHCVKCQKVV